jgi:hypothetical protein
VPPGAGLPRGPVNVLETLFGVGADHHGLCGQFKRFVCAWDVTVLDPTDQERQRAERVAELEAAGDEQAQARIRGQAAAFAAIAGVHATTVASMPTFGRIVGQAPPAVPPTGPPLEDQELERLRQQLGKASTDYVDCSAAHYRKEKSDLEMQMATEALQKAKARFAAREKEILSPAEKAFQAVGPSWLGQG